MADSFQEQFEALVSMGELDKKSQDDSLAAMGHLVDLSLDLRRGEGLDKAFQLADVIRRRDLAPSDLTLLHYFTANAWANKRILAGRDGDANWEDSEMDQEILNLRIARESSGLALLSLLRQCQILTNLGNAQSAMGRRVEALEYWNDALRLDPNFGMAVGNRALGWMIYARALYDRGHAIILLRKAYSEFGRALALQLEPGADERFRHNRDWIQQRLSTHALAPHEEKVYSLGRSRAERLYRQWCLDNTLFLNPLNDLDRLTIAARDVFSVPSMVASIDEGPHFIALFNQLKQEYVSARYGAFDARTSTKPHFSDRDVSLLNTLDYPSYSLATEKLKSAFKTSYSILDKIAFFLNNYFGLAIPERGVTFRTLWYEGQKRKQPLRAELISRTNWPLRALFALSKDLSEDRSGYREAIAPDARELADIRNHLEHKYLKVHSEEWTPIGSIFDDKLAFSLSRRDLQRRTERLLRLVRAALIYLSLAIHAEERRRASERAPSKALSMTLPPFEDRWKT